MSIADWIDELIYDYVSELCWFAGNVKSGLEDCLDALEDRKDWLITFARQPRATLRSAKQNRAERKALEECRSLRSQLGGTRLAIACSIRGAMSLEGV